MTRMHTKPYPKVFLNSEVFFLTDESWWIVLRAIDSIPRRTKGLSEAQRRAIALTKICQEYNTRHGITSPLNKLKSSAENQQKTQEPRL